jgi:hypothetical protein
VMCVFAVTLVTKVCDTGLVIYNILRLVITLLYNRRRLLYIHYFNLVAIPNLLQNNVIIPSSVIHFKGSPFFV